MSDVQMLVEALPFVATGVTVGGGASWAVVKVMLSHHKYRLDEHKEDIDETKQEIRDVKKQVGDLDKRVTVFEIKGA